MPALHHMPAAFVAALVVLQWCKCRAPCTGKGQLCLLEQTAQPLNPCRVDVPAGVTQDVVGKANTAASYSYTYAPQSANYQTVRTTANAVFGGIVGASVAASVGVAAVGGQLPSSCVSQAC